MPARYLLLVVALLIAFVGVARAQSTASTQPQAHWQALLRRVRVGMSRARVERILGHSFAADVEATPELSSHPSGAHTALYVLDTAWCAAIAFDWHGFDPDERRNPYLVFHFPEHRVIARPRLLARDVALDARLHQ